MAILKTRAIILNSNIVNESDVSSEVLTDSEGIQYFLFKSLKKSRRRPQAILEPGAIADFTFYRKGNGTAYVSDFQLLFHPSPVATCYEKILILHLMLEITRKTSAPAAHDSYVFAFLQRAIERLATDCDGFTLLVYFLLHLLRHGGILPDLSQSIFLSVGKRELELCFSHEEYLAIHCALNGRLDESPPIPRLQSERIVFNLLLYLENYYTIVLNGKKLLFSSSNTEMSTLQSVAEKTIEGIL